MPEPCDLLNNELVIDKTRSEHWLRSRVNLNWTIQIWWFMIEVKLCLSETCNSNFLVALWPYLAWDGDEATLNEDNKNDDDGDDDGGDGSYDGGNDDDDNERGIEDDDDADGNEKG